MIHFPEKEIRAVYDANTIRVYQAYSDAIADSAIENNKFVSPPFKMTRMTWIKPSFMWMMYRAGWGKKDNNQKRILAIDITHEGFLWALSNGCLSSFNPNIFTDKQEWERKKETSPVKIQWDPERNLLLDKLRYRTIQIGLSGIAVEHYANQWIMNITEVTDLAEKMRTKIASGDIQEANALAPQEKQYILPENLSRSLGIPLI